MAEKTKKEKRKDSIVLKKLLSGKSVVLKGENKKLIIKMVGKSTLYVGGKKVPTLKIVVIDFNKPENSGFIYISYSGNKLHLIGAELINPPKDKKLQGVFVVEFKDTYLSELDKIFYLMKSDKAFNKISKFMSNKSIDVYKSKEAGINESDSYDSVVKEAERMRKLQMLYQGLGFILAILSLAIWLYFIGKIVATKKSESDAERATRELIKEKFKNQKKMYEFFSEYSELISGIKNLMSSETINGLLVYGKPGTGKTFMTLRTLYFEKAKFTIERGGVKTLQEFGSLLYRNRSGKIIVLDDFDSALDDPDMINILKSATDTYKKRVISIPFAAQQSSDAFSLKPVPEKFVFTSKIIAITNKKEEEIPPAILSRMLGVNISFTNDEMIKMIEKYIDFLVPDVSKNDKLEVLQFMNTLKKKYPKISLDFRMFNTLIELKKLYKKDWKKIAEKIYSKR